jgi:hypothetical protein
LGNDIEGVAMTILRALVLLAAATICSTALADDTSLSPLEQFLAINAMIRQQTHNVAAMQAELVQNPNNPDSQKLQHFFATASGGRTDAFHQLTPFMRNLVDQFESNVARNAADALALGLCLGCARGQFVVEIDRSSQFINELKKRRAALLAEAQAEAAKQFAGESDGQGGGGAATATSDTGAGGTAPGTGGPGSGSGSGTTTSDNGSGGPGSGAGGGPGGGGGENGTGATGGDTGGTGSGSGAAGTGAGGAGSGTRATNDGGGGSSPGTGPSSGGGTAGAGDSGNPNPLSATGDQSKAKAGGSGGTDANTTNAGGSGDDTNNPSGTRSGGSNSNNQQANASGIKSPACNAALAAASDAQATYDTEEAYWNAAIDSVAAGSKKTFLSLSPLSITDQGKALLKIKEAYLADAKQSADELKANAKKICAETRPDCESANAALADAQANYDTAIVFIAAAASSVVDASPGLSQEQGDLPEKLGGLLKGQLDALASKVKDLKAIKDKACKIEPQQTANNSPPPSTDNSPAPTKTVASTTASSATPNQVCAPQCQYLDNSTGDTIAIPVNGTCLANMCYSAIHEQGLSDPNGFVAGLYDPAGPNGTNGKCSFPDDPVKLATVAPPSGCDVQMPRAESMSGAVVATAPVPLLPEVIVPLASGVIVRLAHGPHPHHGSENGGVAASHPGINTCHEQKTATASQTGGVAASHPGINTCHEQKTATASQTGSASTSSGAASSSAKTATHAGGAGGGLNAKTIHLAPSNSAGHSASPHAAATGGATAVANASPANGGSTKAATGTSAGGGGGGAKSLKSNQIQLQKPAAGAGTSSQSNTTAKTNAADKQAALTPSGQRIRGTSSRHATAHGTASHRRFAVGRRASRTAFRPRRVAQNVHISHVSHFHGGGRHRSDIRLKQDIVPLGRLDNGIGLYRFRYKGGDRTIYVGVMAQEVRKILPSAVSRDRDGYLLVDYDRLGIELATWDEWAARRGNEVRTVR